MGDNYIHHPNTPRKANEGKASLLQLGMLCLTQTGPCSSAPSRCQAPTVAPFWGSGGQIVFDHFWTFFLATFDFDLATFD